MKSGTLRQRITIEEYAETQDSAGQPVKAWTVFAERKASIDPVDPMRTPMFRADERFEPGTARIVMRYVPGVTTRMRVVHDGTIYEIIDAADKGTRHRETVLTCRTGINENG